MNFAYENGFELKDPRLYILRPIEAQALSRLGHSSLITSKLLEITRVAEESATANVIRTPLYSRKLHFAALTLGVSSALDTDRLNVLEIARSMTPDNQLPEAFSQFRWSVVLASRKNFKGMMKNQVTKKLNKLKPDKVSFGRATLSK